MRIPIPTDSAGLQELMNDRSRMKSLFEDPDSFKEFMNSYANLRMKNDPSILDQVKEHSEMFLANWLKDNTPENIKRLNLDPLSTKGVRPLDNAVYNSEAMGAKYDNEFRSVADFFNAISAHSFKNSELSGKLETLKNEMSSLKPSDGGFLIPERLRAELLAVALETAIVRPRARVVPMDSLRVPFPTIDATSNVSSVFGGIIGYWTEEGATLTASQPKFGRVVLDAKKLTLYTEVPNELFTDSLISLNMLLGRLFPEALAWFEDVAFMLGGGVGEPLGVLNAPAAITVTRSGTDLVAWADVVAMYSRMLPQSLNRAVWIVSPEVFPQLTTMSIPILNVAGTENVGGSGAWIGNGQGSSAPPMTLLGRPIIVSEKARTLGTAGDINFVDFGYYLIGDRQAMSARESTEYKFGIDVTAFRVIERLDGRPWLEGAITPMNGGSTLSWNVRLSTDT